MQRVIYLDYNATTPVDPQVLDSMIPYFNVHYGNPSSASHPQSWATAGGIKNARNQVARLLNCEDSEVIFTSGATESINLALRGVLELNPECTLISSNIEHSATTEVINWAHKKGLKLKILEVEKNGLVNMDELNEVLRLTPGPKLLSLILAHNEIGSLYSISGLSDLKEKYNFTLHLDATQALLTEALDMQNFVVDMMSFSAHKIYGPKGVGGLYLRKKTIGHHLEPLIYGGGQEYGLRSGTLNVPGIVGLGRACELVLGRRTDDRKHFETLFYGFIELLASKKLDFIINGDHTHRIYQNINITLPTDYDNIHLMSHLNGFCLSQGSACSSQKEMNSNQTLSALGLTAKQMQRTLRIGTGRDTRLKDLEMFVEKLTHIV